MAPTKSTAPDKGGIAEEALRQYFRESGSFVLRAVPVKAGTEDVSDIDLWAYSRTGPLSRSIFIVDIKNKKRGKAFERAVWIKGLQAALGADDVVIASQGAKDSVYAFAARLGVRVLSSTVFDAILKRYGNLPARVSLEALDEMWRTVPISSETLKNRMDACRSQLSSGGLSFSSLNIWVDLATELLGHSLDRERRAAGPITRAFYYTAALAAVCADYIGREHALSDHAMRKEFFRSGLLFGRSDGNEGRSYLDFAESLATEFYDRSGAAAAQMRRGFESTVSSMPIDSLVEFFARPSAGSELVRAAFALEGAAFADKAIGPADLQSSEAKSIVGLLSDYGGHRRADVLGSAAVAVSGADGASEWVKQGYLPL